MPTRVSARRPAAKRRPSPARRAPVQRRSLATVEAILEATIQILDRSGLAALTTNAIAARAGISVGSLYQYFPDKQAVLEALLTRHAGRVQGMMAAALQEVAGLPVLDRVDALARALIAAEVSDLRLSRIFHGLLPATTDSPVDRFEAAMESVVAGILDGAPDLRPRDSALAAGVIVRAASGVLRTTARRDAAVLTTQAFEREFAALIRGYLQTMMQPPEIRADGAATGRTAEDLATK